MYDDYMKTAYLLIAITAFLLISICSSAEVHFEIETERPPFNTGMAILSDDAQVYVGLFGSDGTYIRDYKTKETLGRINFNDTHSSYLSLIQKKDNFTRILRSHWVSSSDTDKYAVLSLYALDGQLIKSAIFKDRLALDNIVIAKGGEFFAVHSDRKVTVYSSLDFSQKKIFSVDQVKAFNISNDGDVLLLAEGENILVFSDPDTLPDIFDNCLSEEDVSKLEFADVSNTSFYLYGARELCLLNEKSLSHTSFKVTSAQDVFFDNDDQMFVLVKGSGLNIYSSVTGVQIGQLSLNKYYEEKYGERLDVRPFFIDGASYDEDENLLLVSGNGGAPYLHKIIIHNQK